jgi:subtilisin-like proprotein convertase family protein
MFLYVNGVLVNQTNTTIVPIGYLSGDCPALGIGNVADCNNNFGYWGDIDEMSLYTRALSDSEISAIAQSEYLTGFPGKFDQAYYNDFSPAQSLAEASVSIAGLDAPTVIYGNNTNWQQETITFTATGNGTPVTITGVEPGMLLDSFTMTALPGDLYYLPEQDMTPVVGLNAYGTWQLEVQDDRVDANTNGTLVSWKLDFTFANTNILTSAFGQLPGGLGQTNTLLAGQLGYYTVNVPTNASYATNLLLYASLPVNVWFTTNFPPTITNTGDVDILPGATNGSYLMGTNGSPVNTSSAYTYIIPGATYYLMVDNTNATAITVAVEVDFDHGNSPNSNLPQLEFASVGASPNGVKMEWPAVNGDQYQVQWTDSLGSGSWQTITDPRMTVINGVATFTDNGSQTAPLGPTRYYRLVQLPPGSGNSGSR